MIREVLDVGDVEDRSPAYYFVEAGRILEVAREGCLVRTAAFCAHGQTYCAQESIRGPAL